MPKRPPKPTRLDPDTELYVRCFAIVDADERKLPLLALPADDGEPPECVDWRRDLEQEAKNGDLAALARLIQFSPRYLTCPWTVAVIQALRSKRGGAKTLQDREDATGALDRLAEALRGHNLKGKRPHPGAKVVATLYDLLLPLYEAAQKDIPQDPIVLPREFCRYLDGRPLPDGIEKCEEPLIFLGKRGFPEFHYRFTIPKADVDRLPNRKRKSRSEHIFNVAKTTKEKVDTLVLERVARILNITGVSDDLDWLKRLVRKGRKSE